jgi:two-component system, repressor protein LuxO
MATNAPRVLLVEDDPALIALYRASLHPLGLAITAVDTGQAALDIAAVGVWNAVVLDLGLPDMSGLDVLKHFRRERPGVPVLVATAHGLVPVAVEAMRQGAYDFLVKPVAPQHLQAAVQSALQNAMLPVEAGNEGADFCHFIGQSAVMRKIYAALSQAAPSKATVLLLGESGTGKEVAAEAVHQCSPRAKNAFIALNCAALPRELLESELFGHVKGAFTGAHADRVGAIGAADSGTLFLDEIGEMDIALQAKLLRFLETSSFQQVGTSAMRRVDVRVVAATNRDPWQAVKQGKLREDLFFRLSVIPITLPPLRERAEDIPRLAAAFVQRFSAEIGKSGLGFSEHTSQVMQRYPWPGNVRELRNFCQRAVLMQPGPWLEAVGLNLGGDAPQAMQPADAMPPRLVDLERVTIESALRSCEGRVHKAAEYLGVNPSTLYRKLAAWKRVAAS